MFPIVNGLEENYSSELSFERLDAAIQSNEQLQLQFGVRGHPTFVVLDKNGAVAQIFIGPQAEEALKNAITAVISNEP